MKPGSKYWPLYDYLREQSVDELTLSLAEIERLLGLPLPASARKGRGWWSNRSYGSVQSPAWMQAGFYAHPDLEAELVTFRRPARVYHIERVGPTVLWTGELVKALRLHAGLSQSQLAARMGVRQQTISEWETGAYPPSLRSSKHLGLVAETLGFDYGETEEPPGGDTVAEARPSADDYGEAEPPTTGDHQEGEAPATDDDYGEAEQPHRP